MALDNLPEDELSPRTFLPVSTSLVRALDMLPLPDHAESAVCRPSAAAPPCSLCIEAVLREGCTICQGRLAGHNRIPGNAPNRPELPDMLLRSAVSQG